MLPECSAFWRKAPTGRLHEEMWGHGKHSHITSYEKDLDWQKDSLKIHMLYLVILVQKSLWNELPNGSLLRSPEWKMKPIVLQFQLPTIPHFKSERKNKHATKKLNNTLEDKHGTYRSPFEKKGKWSSSKPPGSFRNPAVIVFRGESGTNRKKSVATKVPRCIQCANIDGYGTTCTLHFADGLGKNPKISTNHATLRCFLRSLGSYTHSN